MNYKIRNISLLCALLSLSAGSAVAKPGPILSSDGTAFQLNFPPVIVDELNKFIVGVDGHEKYEAFPYKIKTCACDDGSPFCEMMHKDFGTTVQAMAPYIIIPFEERQASLIESNLVGVAKTLLSLHESKAFIPKDLVAYIHIALDYFLNPLDRSIICLPVACPSACTGAACTSAARWQRLMAKSEEEKSKFRTIDKYVDALDDIMMSSLPQPKAKK